MPEILTKKTSPAARAKTGMLLVNLGTPEAASYWPMRAYLKEFLSDPRVIETNRVLWWLVLNGIILTFRPRRSGHAYAQIWNRELNESPLKTFTRAQAEKLALAIDPGHNSIIVDWAMRYGRPSLESGLNRLMEKGCERILICPLYPQYSATTTASVFDKVAAVMGKLRHQPTLRFLPPFYDHPAYIRALVNHSQRHMAGLGWKPQKIIVSYHGLPKSYVEKGDPYLDHCLATSRALARELGHDDTTMITAFQSRMGKMEWLRPYTDETITDLAVSGISKIVVISPAFISDCVETLEELAIGLRDQFLQAGGEKFAVVPCLNDSDEAIAMLKALITSELQGW